MVEFAIWKDGGERRERVHHDHNHRQGHKKQCEWHEGVANPFLPRTWTCLAKKSGTRSHSSDETRPRKWMPLWLCRLLADDDDDDDVDGDVEPCLRHHPVENPRSCRSKKVLSKLHPPA